MLKKLLHFYLLFLSLFGCNNSNKTSPAKAFYYWKTTFTLSPAEQTQLQELGIGKLYVRYFDVDWNESVKEARPVSPIRFKTPFPTSIALIPTVYITNRTLQLLPENQVTALGDNILTKIRQLNKKGKSTSVTEIQLDCDWTESTRTPYFNLVSYLEKKLNSEHINLSVTIRLHQVKYAHTTGIPPADRGMLMFYNMGNLKNLNTGNSIYNPTDAAKYFVNFERYPLKLDVVLPAFSWAVIFRDQQAVGLVNNVQPGDFNDTTAFEKLPNNQVRVKKLQFKMPHYLFPNDVLKLEETDPKVTLQAARQLKPELPNKPETVAIYHWDTHLPSLYEKADLEAIFNTFQ